MPVALVLLLLTSMHFLSAADAVSSAPYLYYYSDTTHNFIIERADGSDKHVLASYSVTEGYSIAGDGWSPSGKWFAWYETIPGGAGPGIIGQTSVVSRDGAEHFVAIEDCSVSSLQWSASDDMLLIGCYANRQPDDFAYYLYDVANRNIRLKLDKHTADLQGDISFVTRAAWSPDGKYVLLYYPCSGDAMKKIYTMRVYDMNGKAVFERQFLTDDIHYFHPFWSLDGKVAYVTPDSRLAIENISGTVSQKFKLPNSHVSFVDWSPTGEFAFIYIGSGVEFMDVDDSPHQLFLLSIPKRPLQTLSEDARHAPLISDYLIPIDSETTWSPNRQNQQGIFIDMENRMYRVDAATAQVKQIDFTLPDKANIYPSLVHWAYDGSSVSVLTGSSSSLNRPFYIFSVSPAGFDLQITKAADDSAFAYSPDNQLLAFGSERCGGLCVYNLVTKSESKLRFTLQDGSSNIPTEVIWHPNGNWLFILGYPVGITRQVNVASVDGAVNRILGTCDIVASCFGWMPIDR